ncbi:MAG: hypothetical protein K6F61_06525 [Clostridiales bacterium]|nr:hypothetical protein [Clostridiales bacterium]
MKFPEVVMPAGFLKMNSMPDDPPHSSAYGFETPDTGAFAMVFPMPAEQAMPYENPQSVIDGIHRALGENQGLIEVETGKTKAGRRYLYSVVKTLRQPHGVQYCMTMHIDYGECAVQVQGFFDELGTTGVRDTMVFVLLEQQGTVRTTEDGIEGWNTDPYNPEYKRGCLMNLSEQKMFDEQFPHHPLSEARRFVAELAELN